MLQAVASVDKCSSGRFILTGQSNCRVTALYGVLHTTGGMCVAILDSCFLYLVRVETMQQAEARRRTASMCITCV